MTEQGFHGFSTWRALITRNTGSIGSPIVDLLLGAYVAGQGLNKVWLLVVLCESDSTPGTQSSGTSFLGTGLRYAVAIIKQ